MKTETKEAVRMAIIAVVDAVVYLAVLAEKAKNKITAFRMLFMSPRQKLELQVLTWIDLANEDLELARQFYVNVRYPGRVDQLEYEISRARDLLQEKSTPSMDLHTQCIAIIGARTKVHLLAMQAAETRCDQLLKELVP